MLHARAASYRRAGARGVELNFKFNPLHTSSAFQKKKVGRVRVIFTRLSVERGVMATVSKMDLTLGKSCEQLCAHKFVK